MFLPKGALMELFRQLNFTERGLVKHFSFVQCHFLTILPHYSIMSITTALIQSFFIQFFFVIKRKFCRLLFCMGPQNTKGASMGPFLKVLQENRGLASAAMHLNTFLRIKVAKLKLVKTWPFSASPPLGERASFQSLHAD